MADIPASIFFGYRTSEDPATEAPTGNSFEESSDPQDVPGTSDLQNIFYAIANSSGVVQFVADATESVLQIAGGSDTDVTFDANNKRITIDAQRGWKRVGITNNVSDSSDLNISLYQSANVVFGRGDQQTLNIIPDPYSSSRTIPFSIRFINCTSEVTINHSAIVWKDGSQPAIGGAVPDAFIFFVAQGGVVYEVGNSVTEGVAGSIANDQVAFGNTEGNIEGNSNFTWDDIFLRLINGLANVTLGNGTIALNTGEDGTASSKMVDLKNTTGGGVDIEKRGGVRIIAWGDSNTGIYILQGHRSSGEVMRIDGNGSYDTEGHIISKWARLYDSTEETITANGTTTINPTITPARNFTLEADRTIQFSTGYSSLFSWGATLRFKQDAIGGRVITWSGSGQQVKWQGNVAPSIDDAPNAVTFISLYWDGVDLYGFKSCGF